MEFREASKAKTMILETQQPQILPPCIMEVEVDCEECGGSGFDPGGVDPWGPEPCSVCHGTKTQRIIRNYLGEALRIVGNTECTLPVERAHLVAIVQYCRQVVDAAMCRPKAPALNRPRTRHGRRSARRHNVVEFENLFRSKGQRENADIST